MTSAGNRILIIDNDAHFADGVASFLTARQFTVFRAETGREGVELAQAERPDLILMDIVMDERTEGFSAIQEIRRTEGLKGVPIFILSSNCVNLPDFETPGGTWLAHDLFLQKPLRLTQLLDKIRSTLARLDEDARAGSHGFASTAAVYKG
jgi:two-component system alkaline phosphatase synthesis response regulator PhoP